MAEVGSAFVSVAPNAKGFGRSLGSQVSGEVSSSGKGIGSKLGMAMKAGLAGAVVGAGVAAVAFIKGAMDEAREAQKVGALTNAVIKSTGGAANVTAKQIGNLSGAISAKTGIDDEAIQSGANMLLTFRDIRNETGKGNDIFNQATKTITDMGAALGKDPKAAAIGLGKALNDPIKGVTALGRVGVQFTASQKNTIKSLTESGDKLGAQKIILKELNTEFGGAAASQATAGDKLKVAWGNAQEAVGTAILPLVDKAMTALTGLITFLTANVGPAFASLSTFLAPVTSMVQAFFDSLSSGSGSSTSFFTNLIAMAQQVATTVLPVLQAMATFFMTQLLPAILQVASYLAAKLAPIFRTISTIIVSQILPVVATLARFFYSVLLPAVLAIVRSVATALKPVFDALFAVLQGSILPAISRLIAKFRQWAPVIMPVVMALIKVIGWLLRMAAAILGKVLPPLIRFIGFLIRNLVRAIILVIGTIVKIIGALVSIARAFGRAGAAVGHFATAVAKGIRDAIGKVKDLGSKVKGAVSGAAQWLVHAGEQIMNGLIAGIGKKVKALIDKMASVARTVRDHLPGSPVKTGPLTSWNKGDGPGAAIVERIAAGLSNTRPVEAGMSALASKVAVQGTASAGVAGVAGGGGQMAMTITNWRDGTGYFSQIADTRVASARELDDEQMRAS